MDEINNIGTRIKETREKKGMKQNALASQVKIAPQTLSAYENGSKIPTLDNLINLARELDVSLDWLVWPERCFREAEENTIGNVARMIDALYSAGYITFGEMEYSYMTEPRWNDYPEEVTINIPSIGFHSEKLSEFLKHYKKMRDLLSDKTIDNSLFQQWLEARISDLDKYMISAFSELTDDDTDGVLPF